MPIALGNRVSMVLMVECWGKTDGLSLSTDILYTVGASVFGGNPPKSSACYVNHRMQNRTCGSVRGLREQSLVLLDTH
jgi:hypothetical protein